MTATTENTDLTRAEVNLIDEGLRTAVAFALCIVRYAIERGEDLADVEAVLSGADIRDARICEAGAADAIPRLRCRDEREVTVRFEGGYPRYTATPTEGQSLWDFVFDCAVGLGSERLTSLMGNEQVRFEVDGAMLTDWGLASQYGGKTVTVVMIYAPTEEEA